MNSKTQAVPKVSDKKLYIYITIIKPLLFFLFPFEEKPFMYSNGYLNFLLHFYGYTYSKIWNFCFWMHIRDLKNFSILHGKQKSKPKLYIMSHLKIILCGFSSVNQSYNLVRTHNTMDLHVKNIPCFTLSSFLYQSSSFHLKLHPSLF